MRLWSKLSKFVVILGVFVTQNSPAGALDLLFSECSVPGKEKVAKCIRLVMDLHCMELTIPSFKEMDLGAYWSCYQGHHALTDALDYEQLSIEGDGGLAPLHGVIFSEHTSRVFDRSTKVQTALASITDRMREKYNAKASPNLWDLFLEYNQERVDSTLLFLSVMLQDYSASERVPFPVMRAELNKNIVVKNKEPIEKFLGVVKKVSRASQPEQRLSLYPHFLQSKHLSLDPSYFYLSAALAKKMLKIEDMERSTAFFIPFLFQASYQLRALDLKLQKGEWPKDLPATLKDVDPKVLQPFLRNIYSAYAGALFGIGRDARIMSYDIFKSQFVASPKEYLRKMATYPY